MEADERTSEHEADERAYEPPAVTEVGALARLTRAEGSITDTQAGDS